MLTVALPMYKSRNNGWLALESLCWQMKVDFDWELIVCEEVPQSLEPFGEDALLKYKERLEQVGCVDIKYLPLYAWVPLGNKWRIIGEKVHKKSEVFMLQASDCWSQPWRLIETYELFKDPDLDWIQSAIGPFYFIQDDKFVLYKTDKSQYAPALNMAFRTKYIRSLRKNDRRRVVDRFLLAEFGKAKGKKLNIGWNDSDHWKYGIDTHGLNMISKDRPKLAKELTHPFYPCEEDIREYIPPFVFAKLAEFKDKCRL